MKRRFCYHCGFKMMARRRPKACPVCGKVSFEGAPPPPWVTPVIQEAGWLESIKWRGIFRREAAAPPMVYDGHKVKVANIRIEDLEGTP